MKKNVIRLILIILLVGTFYIIFGFSSQDGEKSGGLSRKVTQIIVENIFHLSDDINMQYMEQMETIIRKLAHFSIYTIVGLLLMGLVSTYKIDEMKRIYISMIVGIVYATSDEIHQAFIPDRAAKLTDVMIDTFGVALGVTIILLVVKLVKKGK